MVRLGLALLLAGSLDGQSRQDPVNLAQGLTISFASNIASNCRNAVTSSAVQDEVEAELRGADIKVSRAYNASLTRDVDCVALGPAKAGIVVHQCLALREVATVPSQSRGIQMAVTWRNCESLTCPRGSCSAAGLSFGRMLQSFLAELRRRDSDAPARVESAPARQESRAERPSAVQAPVTTTFGPSRTTVTTFYISYILTCLAVVVYWESRRAHLSASGESWRA